MFPRCLRAFAIVAVLCAAAGSARAADEKTTTTNVPTIALVANVGVGTPYGLAGGAIDVAPVPNWVLSLGGGLSLGGPQWAAMTRVRTDGGLGLGVGVSGGRYQDGCTFVCEQGTTRTWSSAHWLNLEVGGENEVHESTRIRGYVGVAFLLNQTPDACSTAGLESGQIDPCTTTWPRVGPLVYLGLSIGAGTPLF